MFERMYEREIIFSRFFSLVSTTKIQNQDPLVCQNISGEIKDRYDGVCKDFP